VHLYDSSGHTQSTSNYLTLDQYYRAELCFEKLYSKLQIVLCNFCFLSFYIYITANSSLFPLQRKSKGNKPKFRYSQWVILQPSLIFEKRSLKNPPLIYSNHFVYRCFPVRTMREFWFTSKKVHPNQNKGGMKTREGKMRRKKQP